MMKNNPLSNVRVTMAGRILYHLLPIRKKIVADNIARVFKGASPKEQSRLSKAFYSHVASLLKELVLQGWMAEQALDTHIEIRGVALLKHAINKGQGCILLTGHLGNWEWGIQGLSRLIPSIGPIHIVRKKISMKWLNALIYSRTVARGMKYINSSGARVHIGRALQQKECVIFVMDQHAETTTKAGIAVDFFGDKAGTYTSLAYFANKYKVPVVPASTYRQQDGSHVIQFYSELDWEENAEIDLAIYNNTLRYNQMLEEMILEHPEQWWWVHRRWKL